MSCWQQAWATAAFCCSLKCSMPNWRRKESNKTEHLIQQDLLAKGCFVYWFHILYIRQHTIPTQSGCHLSQAPRMVECLPRGPLACHQLKLKLYHLLLQGPVLGVLTFLGAGPANPLQRSKYPNAMWEMQITLKKQRLIDLHLMHIKKKSQRVVQIKIW